MWYLKLYQLLDSLRLFDGHRLLFALSSTTKYYVDSMQKEAQCDCNVESKASTMTIES